MKKSGRVPISRKPHALYARVSSDEQREAGTIETQIEAIEQYAVANNITIGGHYLDDGISGVIPFHERAEGARLLADARAGAYAGVICLNHKRIGRETFVILQAVRELERELGLDLLTIRDPIPPEIPPKARAMMRAYYAGAAEGDWLDILANSLDGMERAAREGRWLGGRPPFGYGVVNGRLVTTREQAAIVREIFGLYLSGTRLRGISRLLTSRDIPHPMGWHNPAKNRIWYCATVSRILKTPFTRGRGSGAKRAAARARRTCPAPRTGGRRRSPAQSPPSSRRRSSPRCSGCCVTTSKPPNVTRSTTIFCAG